LAAVFVPVGFIPGIVGKLYQQFALTIAASVLLSAFVALTLTPALSSLLLKPQTSVRKSGILNSFFSLFNKLFRKSLDTYSDSVLKVVRHARYVVILLVLVIFATLVLFRNKPTSFIPLEDNGRLFITFELPEAGSTVRTVSVLKDVMAILKETPGVGHFAAIAGLNVVTFTTKSNAGTVFCQLKPWDERKKKSEQLTD
jgi:HAE1 family hydrophobic/amphiphilic exporter-1